MFSLHLSETPLPDRAVVSGAYGMGIQGRAALLDALSTCNFLDAFDDVARRTSFSSLGAIIHEVGRLSRVARERVSAETDASPEAHAGVQAWEALAEFFSLSNAGVADVVGISEQTYYNWIRKPQAVPRPATLRRLLRLRATLNGLVSQVGRDAALNWFTTGASTRLSRMSQSEDGFEEIMAQASSELRVAAIERLRTGSVRRDSEYGGGDLMEARRIEG